MVVYFFQMEELPLDLGFEIFKFLPDLTDVVSALLTCKHLSAMAQKGVVQILSKRTHRVPRGWIDQFSNLKELDPKLVIQKELPPRIISATIDLGEFSSEEEFNEQVEKISPGRDLRILGGKFGMIVKAGEYLSLHDAKKPLSGLINVNTSDMHPINARATKAIRGFVKYFLEYPSLSPYKGLMETIFGNLRMCNLDMLRMVGEFTAVMGCRPTDYLAVVGFREIPGYWREFSAENIHEYDF